MTLTIRKYIKGTDREPLAGVCFKVTTGDGAAVGSGDGTFYTNSAGEIVIEGLEPGTTVTAREIATVEGVVLDGEPKTVKIKAGAQAPELIFWNERAGALVIQKKSSLDGGPLAGVQFQLTYADGSYVDYDNGRMSSKGLYTTDQNGEIRITGITGIVIAKEVKCLPGFTFDPATQTQTVQVNASDTQYLVFYNTPVGNFELIKVSESDPTKRIPNVTFEIRRASDGGLVDTIKSDKRGLAVSKPLPLSRYTIRETKAPANYGVSDQELTAYLEHEGQIVRFEVTNKSLTTGVSITKTGPKEAMAGQPVNYVLSGIANNSNVRLDNFYWRDTLPAQVRLNTIVTGTYNFPGVYKITCRVNGGEYRTLADNLSTSRNYTLQASSAALGLAANERVTEVMFVFGQAPAGFAQVEKPQIKCTAVAGLTAGSSFVNIADVGGTYNGVWVQAISRWVTTVYGKPTRLPTTGY